MGWLWATPLTLFTIGYIGFAIYKGREDMAKTKKKQLAASANAPALEFTLGEFRPLDVIGNADSDTAASELALVKCNGSKPKSDAPKIDASAQADAKPGALPDGWNAVWDDERAAEYFYSTATGDVTWERPTEPAVARVDEIAFVGERMPLGPDVIQKLVELGGGSAADINESVVLQLVAKRKETTVVNSPLVRASR